MRSAGALVLAFAFAACGARQTPSELVDARAAWERARVGPAAQANTAGLVEAEKSLADAEREHREGRPAAGHLAYIAHRKILAVEADARASLAAKSSGR